MSRRTRVLGCLLVASGFVACACASESTVAESAPPVTAADVEPVVFVALGGDETVNRDLDDPLRDSWTRRLFVGSLPRSSVYVNLARGDATVAGALAQQVPEALELAPTLATLWFGPGDELANTSSAAFERDLAEIVATLQRAGAHVVLIGTGVDGPFAAEVQRVATASSTGSVMVSSADLDTTSGQQVIADSVAEALGE